MEGSPDRADQRPRRPLLYHLAGLGWFARHGEVAATQSLAVLLEERQLRDSLLRHVAGSLDIDLGAVTTFHAEPIHEDGARPDLEGWDSGGRPLMVIEAKFGAELSEGQVRAYLVHQAERLDGRASGALVLLVPSYRKLEAEDVLARVRDRADVPANAVSTGVVTWDEWLEVLGDAAQGLDPAERDAIRCDVRQLRGLCAAMRVLDIPPIPPPKDGGVVDPEREVDLRKLVDEVTRRFSVPAERLIPIGLEPEFAYYRRYIAGGLSDPDCYSAVGVASMGDTPFWFRYHRDTSSFREVADRIMASQLAADARGDGGHIWLPLRIPPDRGGAAIIEDLTSQIKAIHAVAAGPPSG